MEFTFRDVRFSADFGDTSGVRLFLDPLDSQLTTSLSRTWKRLIPHLTPVTPVLCAWMTWDTTCFAFPAATASIEAWDVGGRRLAAGKFTGKI